MVSTKFLVDDDDGQVPRGMGLSWACVEDIRQNLYAGVALYNGVAMFQGIGGRTAKERNVN